MHKKPEPICKVYNNLYYTKKSPMSIKSLQLQSTFSWLF